MAKFEYHRCKQAIRSQTKKTMNTLWKTYMSTKAYSDTKQPQK